MPLFSRKTRARPPRVRTKSAVAALIVLSVAAWPACAFAQREPYLTPKQVEDLRDAAQLPNERLGLYAKYIGERIKAIRQLASDTADPNRGSEIHHLYREFSGLSDELDDNLGSYDQQQADMRKGLQQIIKESKQWADGLNAPPPSQQYDFVRSMALDSLKGLREDAVQMLQEQTALFAKKKHQKHH